MYCCSYFRRSERGVHKSPESYVRRARANTIAMRTTTTAHWERVLSHHVSSFTQCLLHSADCREETNSQVEVFCQDQHCVLWKLAGPVRQPRCAMQRCQFGSLRLQPFFRAYSCSCIRLRAIRRCCRRCIGRAFPRASRPSPSPSPRSHCCRRSMRIWLTLSLADGAFGRSGTLRHLLPIPETVVRRASALYATSSSTGLRGTQEEAFCR